ncbi:HinfI family type II restriction enzyme [Mycoplasma nasistruthionis]|uniref:type II site-specific deoxyribonuclease n=1 Tax=Mycoplasma nasistruthionis TaxID=353852 RepID=A0A5B7XYA5_9MOLU|nr:restriction endonuclease [Mycoplasma nasistruthionis]QCZ36883.1 restriction endonuclease [Mycoplasma nasistruthionis]
MNNDNFTKWVEERILKILNEKVLTQKVVEIVRKQDKKVHIIPKKYRILAGLLQSINIQFGNFIEEFITKLLELDGRYEIIKKYSNKRNNSFKLNNLNEKIIDEYINKQTTVKSNVEYEFSNLQQTLVLNSINYPENSHQTMQDVDLLFKNKISNEIYYLEIKYNDDHDTGKFININKKLIRTYSCLIEEFDVKDKENIKPILFYFNDKKKKENCYLPKKTVILREKEFFKKVFKNRLWRSFGLPF